MMRTSLSSRLAHPCKRAAQDGPLEPSGPRPCQHICEPGAAATRLQDEHLYEESGDYSADVDAVLPQEIHRLQRQATSGPQPSAARGQQFQVPPSQDTCSSLSHASHRHMLPAQRPRHPARELPCRCQPAVLDAPGKQGQRTWDSTSELRCLRSSSVSVPKYFSIASTYTRCCSGDAV